MTIKTINDLGFLYLETESAWIQVMDPYATPEAVRVDISYRTAPNGTVTFLAGVNKNYTLGDVRLQREILSTVSAMLVGTDVDVMAPTSQYYSDHVAYGECLVGVLGSWDMIADRL